MKKNVKKFYLSEASIEWSRKHIEKFCDGDIFPRLFEYKSIWSQWRRVKKEILELNLFNYETNELRIMSVPKGALGYRASHQLHPIDTIIYVSLIHYIADPLEKYRTDYDEGISCSYRTKIECDGSLLYNSHTIPPWKKYQCKINEYLKKYKFVLAIDIANFYNNISVHRVENMISQILKHENTQIEGRDVLGSVIEKFLMSLNSKGSRGIPVGPSPSIVISECILVDLDDSLKKEGIKFTRYSDDFKIFTDCEYEAHKILERFSWYLYSNHKLYFSSSKTKLTTTEEFENSKQRNNNLDNPYGSIEAVELGHAWLEESKSKFEKMLESLNKGEKSKFSLGVSRYFLKMARKNKNDEISVTILKNMKYLLPTIKEVILYLIKCVDETFLKENRSLIVSQIKELRKYELPFVDLWLDHLIVENEHIRKNHVGGNESNDLFPIEDKRTMFLIACSERHCTSVRKYKESYVGLTNLEKRAFFFACQILPVKERVFLNSIKSDNLLDEILIKYVTEIREKSSQ